MKKNFLKLNFTLLMASSLLIFSCGPSEEEVKVHEEKKAEESKKLDAEFDQDINAMLNEGAAADTTKK
jgi:hypothetical protein